MFTSFSKYYPRVVQNFTKPHVSNIEIIPWVIEIDQFWVIIWNSRSKIYQFEVLNVQTNSVQLGGYLQWSLESLGTLDVQGSGSPHCLLIVSLTNLVASNLHSRHFYPNRVENGLYSNVFPRILRKLAIYARNIYKDPVLRPFPCDCVALTNLVANNLHILYF